MGARQYGAGMADTATSPVVAFVPASEASWEDLQSLREAGAANGSGLTKWRQSRHA
jgi:hypothetical protein